MGTSATTLHSDVSKIMIRNPRHASDDKRLLNTKVIAPNKDQAEKVDLCKGFWNPQRKMGIATHFFEILALNRNKNAEISIFLKK